MTSRWIVVNWFCSHGTGAGTARRLMTHYEVGVVKLSLWTALGSQAVLAGLTGTPALSPLLWIRTFTSTELTFGPVQLSSCIRRTLFMVWSCSILSTTSSRSIFLWISSRTSGTSGTFQAFCQQHFGDFFNELRVKICSFRD